MRATGGKHLLLPFIGQVQSRCLLLLYEDVARGMLVFVVVGVERPRLHYAVLVVADVGLFQMVRSQAHAEVIPLMRGWRGLLDMTQEA